MIVQKRHLSRHIQQQTLVSIDNNNSQQYHDQFFWHRMQHMYGNSGVDSAMSHHEIEHYSPSTHRHHHHHHHPQMHHHLQYQHESQSLSPQQSSTSDADETSTPPPPPPSSSSSSSALNRGNMTIAAKIIKKKKPPKKKRKDPNEPQKPVSPYALFFRDTQNDIKKKLANPSFGEISKVVAHMWENIEPEVKEQYKRKAAAAKKEYLKQLAAYRAVQVSHQTPNMHHLLGHSTLQFDPNSLQTSSSIQHQQKQYNSGGGTGGSMLTDNNNLLSSSSNHHHQQQQQQHHHHHPHQNPHHIASYNHHHHHHHHLQQFCQPSVQQQQFNSFHYMNAYPQESPTVYNTDPQILFSAHQHHHQQQHHFDSQAPYSSYESNGEFADHQQYGLLRPAVESELFSSYYTQPSSDVEQVSIVSSPLGQTSTPTVASIVNENLLHNLNNGNSSNNTPQYTDLTAMSTTTNNNGLIEKHYDFVGGLQQQHGTTTTTLSEIDSNSKEEDDDSSSTTTLLLQPPLPVSNENNFHWSQATCLATQW